MAEQTSGTVRVAAIGDIHCTKGSQGQLQPVFAAASEHADILVLCGDLCDYGTAEEAHVLARELGAARIPVVAVLGNHDFESGQQEEVVQILCATGVQMLDGDACEVKGVGFAGVKGFGGGFDRRALGPWGENTIKAFVHEAIGEALKLESALARLRMDQHVVVMHYSPIRATCEGEPPEIFPFLGSSRLEEPINRFPVTAVVHGHAHHGSPEGRTSRNVPVYNVAAPLMRQRFPGRPPFRVIEIPVTSTPSSPVDEAATAPPVASLAGSNDAGRERRPVGASQRDVATDEHRRPGL
ncbi:MAG: metallophosphoesterase [Chloroflexi bacterium]|nr:metallophosphoesterase [Chloroflexota bacterium]